MRLRYPESRRPSRVDASSSLARGGRDRCVGGGDISFELDQRAAGSDSDDCAEDLVRGESDQRLHAARAPSTGSRVHRSCACGARLATLA